jgi:urease accessory protein
MTPAFHRALPLAAALVLAALPAEAHPGHAFGGWAGGFAHPLTGWDHLMAMVAVGLWAAQHEGHARWMIPATFVSLMAAGGAAGTLGLALPGVEAMILISVIVLAFLVFARRRLPLAAGMAVAGLFAFFHGFAHGREIPAAAGLASFGLGFLCATALLHGAGYAIGRAAVAAYWNRLRSWVVTRS